jgi:hypothetical protein
MARVPRLRSRPRVGPLQPFNGRKHRSGAFWEDRYHAAAVETGEHLARCVVYIDLNMVRAGVVQHPAQWPAGGYQEIQLAPERYRIVDRAALAEILGIERLTRLAEAHTEWIEAALCAREPARMPDMEREPGGRAPRVRRASGRYARHPGSVSGD